jgi:hypothetical protein
VLACQHISCLSLQALTATEIKKSAKKEKGYWNYEIINKKVKANTTNHSAFHSEE